MSRRASPLEAESQAAFFAWWQFFAAVNKIPERLCFAVPNGGARNKVVAAQLKAQGVRAGVPDVFLMIPAGGFHALVLEFKRHSEKVRPGSEQEAWIAEARLRNYNTLVVWSTDEAMRAVTAYLADADRLEDRAPRRSV